MFDLSRQSTIENERNRLTSSKSVKQKKPLNVHFGVKDYPMKRGFGLCGWVAYEYSFDYVCLCLVVKLHVETKHYRP